MFPWPYTNLHELNLDWILDVVKEFQAQYTTIDEKITAGKEEIESTGEATLEQVTAAIQQMGTEEQASVLAAINARAEEIMSQIPAEYTELMAMLAKTFSTSTNYKKGDMVIYNNGTSSDMYVFKADHAAGAWNASHVTKTELGSQASVLFNTFFGFRAILTSSDDLNDLYQPGWYLIGTAGHPTHTPEPSETDDGVKIVTIVPRGDSSITASTMRLMTYINTQTGKSCHRLYVSGAWENWTSDLTTMTLKETDLNNVYSNGVYIVPAAASLTNEPVTESETNHHRLLIVFTLPKESATSFRAQIYINYEQKESWIRFFVSGSWKTWVTLNNYQFMATLTTGDDLDNLYNNGWYIVGNNAAVLHAPEPSGTTGQRIIQLIARNNNPGSNTYRVMYYQNLATEFQALRLFADAEWKPWIITSHIDNETYNADFTAGSLSSQGDAVGDEMTVISYNVARYRWSDQAFIDDARLFNLRKFLAHKNADMVCTQEDFQYIDSNNSKSAQNYIWNPKYPRTYKNGSYNGIHAKYAATSNGCVKYGVRPNAYRAISWALYTVGSNTVLICATHANWNDAGDGGTSEANIAVRQQQYDELFKWATRAITLPDYTTGNDVTAPEHTHTILCLDANSQTDTDKTNLATLAAGKNFILANGGRFGWIKTARLHDTLSPNEMRIDNIAVSDNVIIEDFEVCSDWYQKLWSDHAPIMAKVRLLNS